MQNVVAKVSGGAVPDCNHTDAVDAHSVALAARVQVHAALGNTGLAWGTGSEQVNETLSLQRAAAIRQRLATEAPALAARSRVTGMGWRDNIVGSGTDNAADALDRRVEFKIIACG